MTESPKLPEHLESRLATVADDDLVEVVVELAPPVDPQEAGLSRAQKIAARKQAFERDAGPVTEAIHGAGGEVVGRAWINQTLKARVPKRAVATVAGLGRVAAVDAPRRLELESEGEGEG